MIFSHIGMKSLLAAVRSGGRHTQGWIQGEDNKYLFSKFLLQKIGTKSIFAVVFRCLGNFFSICTSTKEVLDLCLMPGREEFSN